MVDESSADTEEPAVVRATGLVRVSAGGAGFDAVPVARRETKEMRMIEYDNENCGGWSVFRARTNAAGARTSATTKVFRSRVVFACNEAVAPADSVDQKSAHLILMGWVEREKR